ncbi:MAG: putative transposase YbfD/YdcC [Rickettsiales bacterium]|jgi:predicted transposase YbfD/YdcC
MTHPDWAQKHKRKNTEIRVIRGNYYLYGHTSKWCPIKKRTKKVTTGYIGSISQEHGLVLKGGSRKGKLSNGVSRVKEDAFTSSFKDIADPRSSKNQLHSIHDIMFIALASIICGAEGWKDMENYGKLKINMLQKFCLLKNGIPTKDTFRRFFNSLNPDKFKEIFRKWSDNILPIQTDQIAIDGKASRRTHDEDIQMLHTVSAYSTDSNMILAQDKVSEKSNEITAIPKLLNFLDIKDVVITIDAMGCQYKIADLITDNEGDYIFSLKGNQGNLSEYVESYFQNNLQNHASQNHTSFTKYNKGHGRIETRECIVSTDVVKLHELNPKWKTIKSIIQINSKREFSPNSKEGKKHLETNETKYYVSSLKNKEAEQILKYIRDHWKIENSLHWVLDMTFNEDQSRIRKKNAAEIMTILRHIAINQIRLHKPQKDSLRSYRKMCGWSDDFIVRTISKSCQ